MGKFRVDCSIESSGYQTLALARPYRVGLFEQGQPRPEKVIKENRHAEARLVSAVWIVGCSHALNWHAQLRYRVAEGVRVGRRADNRWHPRGVCATLGKFGGNGRSPKMRIY